MEKFFFLLGKFFELGKIFCSGLGLGKYFVGLGLIK